MIDIELFKLYINIQTEDDSLLELFLTSAENIVENYLNKPLIDFEPLPGIIQLTVFRIGALLNSESSGNIGITSKSFSDGSRTFIKTQDYEPYLKQISQYRIIEEND